jgi:hypothetical protein
MKKFFSQKTRYVQLFTFVFAAGVFGFTSEWATFAFVLMAGVFWFFGELYRDASRDAIAGWEKSLKLNDDLLEENRRLTGLLLEITTQLESIPWRDRQ